MNRNDDIKVNGKGELRCATKQTKKARTGALLLLHLPYGLMASREWKRKSTRQSGGGSKPLSVAFHFLLSLQPQLLVSLWLPKRGKRFVTSHWIITVL